LNLLMINFREDYRWWFRECWCLGRSRWCKLQSFYA